MIFERTEIEDVVIVTPNLHGDERGYFSETYKKKSLEEFVGYKVNFIQDNESKSSYGVLRGLHYQIPPFAQSKLVRVIEGWVLDVAVDIRKGSPTFGKHIGVELSGNNKKQLFVPRGFAHGFLVLSDFAIFSYKVDNYYSPSHDRGLAFNDKILDIDWRLPLESLKLSSKDTIQPVLPNIDCFDFNSNLYV
jgi:dTDP-4-dehydrorhamnose 3,5-epimerase